MTHSGGAFVEIIFHSHGAAITESTRQHATRLVTKLAARVRRPVEAVIRVERDGPDRLVEIVLSAPRSRALVGKGRGRSTGPALAEAAANLGAQLEHTKRKRRPRPRAGAGA
jgi:ribosome-associated translation inhibitor RaiA